MPDSPSDKELTTNPDLIEPEVLDSPRGPTYSFDTERAKGHESSVRVAMVAEVHEGPLPSPAVLRQLAEIYPEAPKVIFDEFKAQARHRRELEQIAVRGGIDAGRRGQLIGGLIGVVGILGSIYAIVEGFPAAGASVATACVVSLVVVFVTGREKQMRERVEKAKTREKIKRRDPVESFAEPDQSRGDG